MKIFALVMFTFFILLTGDFGSDNTNAPNICYAQSRPQENNHTKPKLSNAQAMLIYESWIKFMVVKQSKYKLTFFLRFDVETKGLDKKHIEKLLISRFKTSISPVVSISDKSRFINHGANGYIDHQTGNRGTILTIHKLNTLSQTKVKLYGGWRTGGRAGKIVEYTLELKDKHWQITEEVVKGQI